MKDIMKLYDKTITDLKVEISNIEENLKTILNSNQNIRDPFLKQTKLKKLNYLKYGPKQTQQYSLRNEESIHEDQTTGKITKFVRSGCEER